MGRKGRGRGGKKEIKDGKEGKGEGGKKEIKDGEEVTNLPTRLLMMRELVQCIRVVKLCHVSNIQKRNQKS